MNQIRKRLTYANVMSSLAVFLVLGGATAFAATKIGANEIKANSIKTGKIVKEAVTAGKIKAKAVTESRIAEGAVTTSRLADGAVTGAKLNLTGVTVPNATNAANAVKATNATNATNAINAQKAKQAEEAEFAEFAESAEPAAYARVIANSAGGGVDEQFSKGITDADVTFVGGSVYCFNLGFAPQGIQATVDWIGGGANTHAQATLQEFAICPPGTDASVRTTDKEGGGIGTISFYVEIIE